MTNTAGIQFTVKGIGSILHERYLAVPKFQRSYAWRVEHVTDLLNDLSDAVGREPEYFLGTIVFARGSEDHFEVIDGQQRLATVMILLAAMRNYLRDTGDNARADSLESEFLRTKERRSQELRPKLRLNAKDHSFFEKTIVDPQEISSSLDSAKLRESHSRILDASSTCRSHVEKLANSTRDPAEKLLDWVDFIDKNLKVVVIDVPDDANAFMIFETLNDRGAELSIADLLKNYLFGRAGDRIDEVEEAWNLMFAILEAIGGEDLILTYIRHLWSSMHGATREKDLYSGIKSQKRSKRDIVDFAEDLALHAPFYSAIVHPRTDFWTSYGPGAREAMLALERLRLEQFRPLLLAVLAEFPAGQVAITLRYLLSCSVRFLIVGGLGGGTMEKVYSDVALKVRNKSVSSASDIFRAMKDGSSVSCVGGGGHRVRVAG